MKYATTRPAAIIADNIGASVAYALTTAYDDDLRARADLREAQRIAEIAQRTLLITIADGITQGTLPPDLLRIHTGNLARVVHTHREAQRQQADARNAAADFDD